MAKTLLDLFRGSPHDTGVQPATITAAEQDEDGIKTLPIEDINDPDAVLIEDTFNSSEHASDVTADDITATEQDEDGIKTLGITDVGDFTTTPILDLFNASEHASDVTADDWTVDEQEASGVTTLPIVDINDPDSVLIKDLYNSSEHSNINAPEDWTFDEQEAVGVTTLGITDVGDFTTNTIIDTFNSSVHKSGVESDKQTYFTQELSGIRINSAVELNNPLIYGTGVPRIMLRTTPTLDIMRHGTNAGKSPADQTDSEKAAAARYRAAMASVSELGDLIGLPKPMIPSRMVDEMLNPPMGPPEEKSAYQVMLDKSGINLGSLGGTPSTVLIQGAGALIRLGKEKLRAAMLGRPPTEGEVDIYSSKIHM